MKAGIIAVVATVVIIVGGVFLANRPVSEDPNDPIVSRVGVHEHASIRIFVDGEEVGIPANLGSQFTSMHTHEPNGIAHLETSGVVRESDMALAELFNIWRKDFSKSRFLEHDIEEGDTLIVTVNGEEVSDFENIIMRDGDEIVIRLENGGDEGDSS